MTLTRRSPGGRLLRPRDRIAIALVVLAGAALRLRSALGTFVAPDEAIVLGISAGRGPAEICDASLSNPHPPLVYLLLSAWLRLGRGDLLVRLLPILLTSLALVLMWRTASALLGRSRALFGVALVAASPTLVPATTEVRPYPLLLLLAAASVEALRRATGPVAERRRPATLAFAALAALAVATHYSAVLLLAGLFPWAAARVARNVARPGERLGALAAWAVPAVAFGLFWVGHISHQISGGLAGGLLEGIYASGLGAPGEGGAIRFVARQAWQLLRWAGGPLAPLVGLALLAGLVHLARRRGVDVLLVLGPLLTGIAVALLGLHPFGGFRQSTYLLVPLAAGLAAGVPALPASRRLPAAAALVVLAWGVVFLGPDVAPSGLRKAAQRRADLDAAISSVETVAGARPVVLVDLSSSVVLAWYHGDPGVDYWRSGPASSTDTLLGGMRLRIGWLWAHDGESLRRSLDAARADGRGGSPVRLLAVWPVADLERRLASGLAPFGPGTTSRRFGEGVLTAALP